MRVRVKFSKEGSLCYIGHLDLMRFFQKALRRAGVDVAYSEGFSPHQIMSFAAPLGVGVLSVGEYMDLQLRSLRVNLPVPGPEPAGVSMHSGDFVRRLQAACPPQIRILSVKLLEEGEKNAMASVAAADYAIFFREERDSFSSYARLTEGFLAREHIFVERQADKGEKGGDGGRTEHRGATQRMAAETGEEEKGGKEGKKRVDLRPGIFDAQVHNGGLFLKLRAGSAGNLRPLEVAECFLETGKEGRGEDRQAHPFSPSLFQLVRLEMYAEQGEGFVPLENLGKEF